MRDVGRIAALKINKLKSFNISTSLFFRNPSSGWALRDDPPSPKWEEGEHSASKMTNN
jgi:hypothetical protein